MYTKHDTVTAALAALLGHDHAALACVSWLTTPGDHSRYDVAVVGLDAWQAWWPEPHRDPPTVFWWTSTGDASLDRGLREHGIRAFGPPCLPENIAAPLRAHVRAPRPVKCDHCAAPVARGAACRYCGSRS